MAYKYSFPIKRALLGVTAIFGIFILLLLIDALDEAQEEYQIEKRQLLIQLQDLTHTLRSVEFEMTAHSDVHSTDYPYSLVKKRGQNACYIYSDQHRAPGFDFVYAGPEEMCEPGNALAHQAEELLPTADVMAYLVNLVDKVSSFYFISRDKYMIASPSALAKSVNGSRFDQVIEERPFWINTMRQGLAKNNGDITFTGEYLDLVTGRQVVTLTAGLYSKGQFIGVLAMDVQTARLKGRYGREYRISDWPGSNHTRLTNYSISKPLRGADLDTGLYLNVEQSWQQHLSHLWHNKYYQLITLIMVYLFIVSMLMKKSWSVKYAYERYLMLNHSDSGLLNLNGVEDGLTRLEEKPYLAALLVRHSQWEEYRQAYGAGVVSQLMQHTVQVFGQRLRDQDLFAQTEEGDLLIVMPAESPAHADWLAETLSGELKLSPCWLEQGGRIDISLLVQAQCFPVHHYDDFSHLWAAQKQNIFSHTHSQRAGDSPGEQY